MPPPPETPPPPKVQSLESLKSQYAIPNAISYEVAGEGLPKLITKTSQALAELYPHGGHVTHYQPAGHSPVLFLSRHSAFSAGKAIRGGVPVIFPWFADNKPNPSAPAHGFARTNTWNVAGVTLNDDASVTIVLRLESGDVTRAMWPYVFQLTHTIDIGPVLTMSLEVTNTFDEPFRFEEALHTYLQVGDVRHVTVTGLSATPYVDKTHGFRQKVQDDSPITIDGETDRVYHGTPAPCVVADPELNRRITVSKTGSNSTVIWNPWMTNASSMSDLGDHEWSEMLCIETANVGDHAIKLEPGQSHRMQAVISVET